MPAAQRRLQGDHGFMVFGEIADVQQDLCPLAPAAGLRRGKERPGGGTSGKLRPPRHGCGGAKR